MTVYDVLEYLASGMTTQETLDDFPYLTHDDIMACLAYAADREKNLLVGAGVSAKLILDQNLSPKLIKRLSDLYPDSVHLETEGLGTSDDLGLWDHALRIVLLSSQRTLILQT